LAEEATGYKQRLDSARERLITGNLRLVIRVAKKYAGQGCSLMDLVQDGNIGLMKAVERFEDRRGFRFSTYAYWWLSQAMQRSIVEKARTIRLPTHIAIKKRMLALVSRELTQRLARIPSHKESADELRIPVVEVDRLLTAVTELETLTFPAEGPDCIVPGGLPDPNSPSPLEKLVREESRGRVNSLLRVLDDREKRIICLRFGLDGTTPKTLRQVGAELGLSAERVRQIQRHAMRTLQAKRNRPIGPSRRPAYTGAIIVPDEAKQANFAAGRTAKGRPHPMGGAGQSGDVAKAN
jgi:RNA polymerase sigma factor (sigma-70 family)